MIPSAEYLAIKALDTPKRSACGDMWLCRRLGIVRVFNGHKRGSRRGLVNNSFHLYHWGKPSMWSSPCEWRDNDPNAGMHDPAIKNRSDERWEYLGNIFEMLPYASLAERTSEAVKP